MKWSISPNLRDLLVFFLLSKHSQGREPTPVQNASKLLFLYKKNSFESN